MNCKLLLAFALTLVVSLAFFGLFGTFTLSDDEGYSIGVIRGISEGSPLYTQQFDFHGPLPFLVKAFVFRIFGVPVTHQSVRLWVLAIWLVSCLILSTAVWTLTKNPLISVTAIIVTGVHLFSLRFGPGHPEDFVVIFLSLAILFGSLQAKWLSENLRAAALGFIGAILLMTKINVGLFLVLGVALWMLASVPRRRPWPAVAALFTITVTLLPAVLMRSFLGPSWQLLLISTLSILLTCLACFRLPIPSRFRWQEPLFAFGAMAVTIAATVAWAWINGSRPTDMFDQTVLAAVSHSGMIVRPVFTWMCAPIVVPFLFLSMTSLRPCIGITLSDRWAAGLPYLKIVAALAALMFAACMLPQFYMPLIGPLCWLVVFPDGRASIAGGNQSARLLIASIAVFQTLQAFPIRGAQTAWSTLALSICCLLLLHDGISELSRRRAALPQPLRIAIQIAGGIAACLLTIFAVSIGWSYFHNPSLAFEESNLIRVPMSTIANLDWVVANVGRYCDATVTQPGLDSLLLWSSASHPDLIQKSPVLLVDWPITMPPAYQQKALAKLKLGSRVCAVYNKRLSEWWIEAASERVRAELRGSPLLTFVNRLHPIRTVGDYEIRVNDGVLATWDDDYVLNGVRDIENGRNAVGVPAELLTGAPGAELAFSFSSRGAGPLLSADESLEEADDANFVTRPLVYISHAGRIVICAKPGVYVPLPESLRVTDGNWHQVSLRRIAQAWAMSVDGLEYGTIGDFLRGNNPPRYLQLGPAYIKSCPEFGRGWARFYGCLRDVRVHHPSESGAFPSAALNVPR